MATEYAGYLGKILLVDLTMETAVEYPWTDAQRKQTLGGKSAAMEILSQHLTGGEQPFSEENWIIFSTGPLTGTGVPGSERFEITALSPQTGLVASSNCGGKFGVFLKKAGLDALILQGRCKSPCWLEINEQGVFFHDAEPLWGLGTFPCRNQLTDLLSGKDFQYLCIGPAGEDLLPCATVISDGRAVGRKGFGAILGFKGVKAITVSGNREISLYDPEAAGNLLGQWKQAIARNPLTSDPSKFSSCPGCPIRCKKKETIPEPSLKDLGMDPLEADRHAQWLARHGIVLPPRESKSRFGKRRNEYYHAILAQLALPPGESTFRLYQDLTEALSAMGLCIFTAAVCFLPAADKKNGNSFLDPGDLLFACTGIRLTTDQLLEIGNTTRKQYQTDPRRENF